MAHKLVRVSDDHVDAIVELMNRTFAADRILNAMARDEWVALVNSPSTSQDADARVVLVDGEIVGWVFVHFRPSGEAEERVHLNGCVDIDHRGTGIGSALVEWAIARSKARFATVENDLPRSIRVEVYSWQQDRFGLLSKFGLEPVRYFHEMIRPLDALPPVPEIEFEIVPWQPHHDVESRIVNNEAFRDHWGSTPTDAQAWSHWMSADHGTRTDLSFAALDEGKMVGLALNAHYPLDTEINGRKEGWIDLLGTLKAYRQRGIAAALLIASFHAFTEAGFDHAALGVDTASPTGADRLYTNLGFVTDRQSTIVELPVND